MSTPSWNYRTIIEPFKIKVVEPIRMTTREERQAILRQAHYLDWVIKGC